MTSTTTRTRSIPALVALLALCCAFAIPSCTPPKAGDASGGEETSQEKQEAQADPKAMVRATMEAFIRAIKDGDENAMYACIVNDEIEIMKKNKKGIDEEDREVAYEILSVKMDGEVGVCEVSTKAEGMEGKSTFFLVEEDGAYKVSFRELERQMEARRKAAAKDAPKDPQHAPPSPSKKPVPVPEPEPVPEPPAFDGVIQWNKGFVMRAAFSPLGQRIVATSIHGPIALWDVETGKQVHAKEDNPVAANWVGFSDNGGFIVTAHGVYNKRDDDTVKMWKADSLELVRTFEGHEKFVIFAQFFDDGMKVVSGAGDDTIRIWDAATGKELKKIKTGHGFYGIAAMAVTLDGSTAATSTEDGFIKLWSLKDGTMTKKLQDTNAQVLSLAFSKDGSRLLVGDFWGVAKIWDVAAGKVVRKFAKQKGEIKTVAFFPEEDRVLTGGKDKKVRIWKVADGALEKELADHTGGVNHVAVAPNGTAFASVSNDGTIRIRE